MAEWLKAADCKSAHVSVRWFESNPAHQLSEKELREIVTPFSLGVEDVRDYLGDPKTRSYNGSK